VRFVDFRACFGADVDHLVEQPADARRWEIELLGHELHAHYTPARSPLEPLMERVNAALTRFVATLTGQEVVVSSQVRRHGIAKLLMPEALGSCDPISGDIAVFDDVGPLTPHVLAHELCHRHGYLKELHAQVLAYLAMRWSGDPELVQGARLERLHRQLKVHQRHSPVPLSPAALCDLANLRGPLREAVGSWLLEPEEAAEAGGLMRKLYDARMRLSGQNGLTDYDEGFLNFLHTFRHAPDASQPSSLTRP
jgi:GNAT superfamily N-acetyltransferase